MKASRELSLLRILLQRGIPQQIGGGKLKLIEFEKLNGDKTYVNPEDVSFVEKASLTTTRIHLKSGQETIVKGTSTEVQDTLQQG
jgi:uncharacterized protein YlzI (FlbEa/FlbD family)